LFCKKCYTAEAAPRVLVRTKPDPCRELQAKGKTFPGNKKKDRGPGQKKTILYRAGLV